MSADNQYFVTVIDQDTFNVTVANGQVFNVTLAQGIPGTPGTNGTNGTRGSLWYEGSGAPGTITGVLSGDLYLNLTNGDVYVYTASWGVIGNIKGPTGSTGATGSTGPSGPNTVSTTTTTNINGMIKGNGTTIAMAIDGTDYQGPLSVASSNGFIGTIASDVLTISTSGSAGSVYYANTGGSIGTDNSNFYYNAGSSSLGIGTNSPQARIDITTNNLGAAPTQSALSASGLSLSTLTAATAGVPVQQSPALRLRGYGWATTALNSQATDWAIFNLPVQGTTAPSTNLTFQTLIGAGSYGTVLTITSSGSIIATGNASLNGSFQTSNTNTNSNLYVAGNSVAAAQSVAQYLFASATSIFARTMFYGSTSTVLTVGASYGAVVAGRSIVTTFTSGTHALLANVVVNPLGTVTSGGAAVTNTASLYIDSSGSGGTNNYAFLVNSGVSLFKGNLVSGLSLLMNGSGAGALTHNAAATTTSYTLTWPAAQGSANTYLKNNGSGTLTWAIAPSGVKNYFSLSTANGDFESGAITPWTAFTTTLSGGVPTTITGTATNMALAVTTTNPLSGVDSGQLTKSAANAVGQGFISGTLTIDREDLAKMMTGSFYYEVVSGTFDASGSSTQSLEIWVYNITGNYWIQPQGYRGMNQTSGQGRVSFTFQTDATAANNTYRIAVLTAQTATTAYVVNFDDFTVGPQTAPIGAAITSPVAWTPTFTGFGTVTNVSAVSQRVGSRLVGNISFSVGTATAVQAQITLGFNGANANVSIDASSLASTINSVVGEGAISAAFANSYLILAGTTNQNYIMFGNQNSSTGGNIARLGTDIAGTSGTAVSINFDVPIVGWSSNVQMSNDTDTRVVACYGNNQSFSGTATGGGSLVPYIAPNKDTHAGFNAGTSTYTVPVSGYYLISASVVISGTTTGVNAILQIKQNGSVVKSSPNIYGASGVPQLTPALSGEIFCNAGDTINFFQQNNITSPTFAGGDFSITRVSGPSVIAVNESVNARYFGSATAVSSTLATIVFANKDYDTHNAFSAAGYTVPTSGKYQFNFNVQINGTIALNTQVTGQIQKNGTSVSEFNSFAGGAMTAQNAQLSDIIQCLAGDVVRLQVSSSATGPTVSSTTSRVFASVARIGN